MRAASPRALTRPWYLNPPRSKTTFVIPAKLGYGSRGAPPVIGPDATLVFHVELIKVG